MKLGISELAWNDIDNLESMLKLLQENNINFIETVIPKHVNWKDINLSKLYNLQSLYKLYNIEVLSTQSIMYNTDITSIYDPGFINHIKLISNICSLLDIKSLVLGAPSIRNNRFDINQLSLIFQSINKILRDHDQVLLLEPNCQKYGGEYFFTIDEIINFISYAELSNVSTMIDTHNILNENQIPADLYIKYIKYIKHVHVSENNLSRFINSEHHVNLSNVLSTTNYSGQIVYETKHINFEDIKLFSIIYNK